MPKNLKLYISAGPDLEFEREALGKAVAQMPISLGWTIWRTPRRGEPLAEAEAAIRQADFFFILMGEDITAPVGMELDIARRAQRPLWAYLKQVARTPAALVFVHQARLAWVPYHHPSELAHLMQGALARRLLDHSLEYGLSLEDWERLANLIKAAEEADKSKAHMDGSHKALGGAGGGGVILPTPPGG